MYLLLEKFRALNPESIDIDFNEHWVYYETIEQHETAPYVRWVSDAARSASIAQNRMWSVRVVVDDDRLVHFYGTDPKTVACFVAKELGVIFNARDLDSDFMERVEAIIGDRTDTHLSVSYRADHSGDDVDVGVSEEDQLAIIDEKKLWMVQWYPRTPVGFYILGSLSLPRALEQMAPK